jgi:acyl-CoA thioesterase-1
MLLFCESKKSDGILRSENEELMHRDMVMRSKRMIFFLLMLMLAACTERTSEPKQENETSITRPWKLICLGGDWTIGAGLAPEKAYPTLLAKQLSALQPVKVVNAGIKGESVSGAADRVDWILQQRLDALLIHYGTISSSMEPLSVRELEDWKRLLSKIRLAYPELPVYVGWGSTWNGQENAPQGLDPLLEQFDVRWIVIHIPDQVAAPQYWQSNGGLPSEEGQEILAEQLFSVFSPLVKVISQ